MDKKSNKTTRLIKLGLWKPMVWRNNSKPLFFISIRMSAVYKNCKMTISLCFCFKPSVHQLEQKADPGILCCEDTPSTKHDIIFNRRFVHYITVNLGCLYINGNVSVFFKLKNWTSYLVGSCLTLHISVT